MVIPLYFLPLLSSLPTNIHKQITSRQHSIQGSIQGDNNGINMRLSISMRHYSGLDNLFKVIRVFSSLGV